MRALDGSAAYCPPFTPMTELLAPVEGEVFAIQRFSISEGKARLQQVLDVRNYGRLEAGDYMRLVRLAEPVSERDGQRDVIMSDTPNERLWNREAVRRAHGHVLIAGLGIGMILPPILIKPEVKRVVIVEKELEVIDLTWYNNLCTRLTPLLTA